MKNMKRTQAGFTLTEVMITVTILIILAGYKLYPMMMEARQTKAAAQGVQLATWGNSIATYSTKYYGQLVNNTAIPGVANIYAPTVDNLKSLGMLATTFNPVNMYGGGYAARITKSPAACVAPDCDVENLAYLTNPIVNSSNSRVDGPALGRAASHLGADGGYSDSATPNLITGPAGSWTSANPVTDPSTGAGVPGILAMRSGYNSSALAQFMRRDGQLPATGAQDMGGQDVNNVNGLRSTTIMNSGAASVGGALGVVGETTTNGITNNGTLQTGNTTITGTAAISGAATVGGTLDVTGVTTTHGITNTGTIKNTGDVETGRLYLKTIVANGASCPGLTGYQASTAAGSIASCINEIWRTPAADIPPPSPCSATTVYFQGCTGSVPYTQHGSTVNATVTAGSGSAMYSCNNGTWALQSSNCTPPPSNCTSRTLSWSGTQASCSGSTGFIAHGSGTYVNSNNGNTGTVYASCNNGVISESSPTCRVATTTYSNPRTKEGYYISENPSNRQIFCESKGKRSTNTVAQADRGGQSVNPCYAINGDLSCGNPRPPAVASCKNEPYGNPGCWVSTSITCQG